MYINSASVDHSGDSRLELFRPKTKRSIHQGIQLRYDPYTRKASVHPSSCPMIGSTSGEQVTRDTLNQHILQPSSEATCNSITRRRI